MRHSRLTTEDQQAIENEFLHQEHTGGMVTRGLSGRFTIYYADDKFVAMLGYRDAWELMAALDGAFANALHPDDLPQFTQSGVDEDMTGVNETTCRMRRKDGSWFWMVVRSRVTVIGTGEQVMVSMCTDMSEFVRQKNELEQQHFITETMMKKLPGGYYRCTCEKGYPFLYTSDGFLNMLGWEREDISSRFNNTFANLLHPDDYDKVVGQTEEFIGQGSAVRYENMVYRIAGRDGYHWVAETTMKTLVDGEQQMQCFIFEITQFIVEREKRQHEVEELRSRQLDTLNRELELSEKRLNAERMYMDVMTRNAILVYHLDVYEDSAEVIKLAPHANVKAISTMRKDGSFCFSRHLDEFTERFVVSSKQEFLRLLSREYITSQMNVTPRFSFRYESLPNDRGNRNYEVRVVRVNPDEFDGKVLVVSEEIDDAIAAERQQQEKLNTWRQYMGVLASDFVLVYHVDLNNNTADIVSLEPSITRDERVASFLQQSWDYKKTISEYCRRRVAPALQGEFMRVMEAHSILNKLEGAPRFCYRYRVVTANNEQRYFETQALRMTDDPGNGNVLITLRSIDDVVTAEQQHHIELEESIERERNQNEVMRALGRNYHAIFRMNLEDDTYIEIACRNEVKRYYNTQETSAAKLMSGLCDKIVEPRYAKRMRAFFDLSNLAKRLDDREFIETDCVTQGESWHRVRFIVNRRDKDGKVTHVLYVSQVIDDEKQYEEHLIAKAEYADYANKAKTEFISQVAHDIRTPMNSIFGFLEIAEANLDDREKLLYSLKRIRAAGEFLKDLADDVLDISRMEHGKMKLEPVQISLTKLLGDFAASMRHAKTGKKQRLFFNFHDISHDCIRADPLRLKQIYSNVFSNAIKYTPDGGSIEFEVYQEEKPGSGKVRIVSRITDTGIGMSEKFMKKMFSKFERGTDTRINQVSGYGLGLAIVKQLVDMMKGTINVYSKQGEGSSFYIKIDVPYSDMETVEAAVDEPVDHTACAGMHLLVAEDNELNREVITELLAIHGVTCDCAADGKLCLERFREAMDTYDAILMDMQMPNLSGVEATRMIRALPEQWARDIPIIAMTANALRSDVLKCLNAGMDMHLSKPVDTAQLLRALGEARKRRADQQ